MILPTASLSADTTKLWEQIATARETLTAAVSSLDGALEAQYCDGEESHLSAPLERLVMSLCDSLGSVRNAERWLGIVERALEQEAEKGASP